MRLWLALRAATPRFLTLLQHYWSNSDIVVNQLKYLYFFSFFLSLVTKIYPNSHSHLLTLALLLPQ